MFKEHPSSEHDTEHQPVQEQTKDELLLLADEVTERSEQYHDPIGPDGLLERYIGPRLEDGTLVMVTYIVNPEVSSDSRQWKIELDTTTQDQKDDFLLHVTTWRLYRSGEVEIVRHDIDTKEDPSEVSSQEYATAKEWWSRVTEPMLQQRAAERAATAMGINIATEAEAQQALAILREIKRGQANDYDPPQS